MRTWFICKVKYQKEDDSGRLRNITEPYLVDALSYTEAESRTYQEMEVIIRGEFYITSITKSKIIDVFQYEDADTWYKCKITYTVTDADSGKEKKVVNQMVITANDAKEAYDRIYESLDNMLVTFKVVEIIESPIVEVFPYVSEEDRETVIPDHLTPVSEVEPPSAPEPGDEA